MQMSLKTFVLLRRSFPFESPNNSQNKFKNCETFAQTLFFIAKLLTSSQRQIVINVREFAFGTEARSPL